MAFLLDAVDWFVLFVHSDEWFIEHNLGLTQHYFSLTFSANSRNSLACLWLALICNCASCREFSVVRIGAKASSSVAISRAWSASFNIKCSNFRTASW